MVAAASISPAPEPLTLDDCGFLQCDDPNVEDPAAPSQCIPPPPGECGNGIVEVDETCDDSVIPPADGDGCSAVCQMEEGFLCLGAPSVCATVELSSEDNDDATKADGPVTDGQTWSGDIEPSGDVDWYAVSLVGGQVLTVETIDGGDGACADLDLDSRLRIFDSNGTGVLATDDDGGGGFCSLIAFTAPVDGTYCIVLDAITFEPDATFNDYMTVAIE